MYLACSCISVCFSLTVSPLFLVLGRMMRVSKPEGHVIIISALTLLVG